MKLKLLSGILFFVFTSYLGAQINSRVQMAIEQGLQQGAFKHSNVSACVTDVTTGSTIAGYRADRVLTPASVLKLISSYAALETLGKEFRFETTLAHTGKLEPDGTLSGDLYVIGSGDPSLGSNRFSDNLNLDGLLSVLSENVLNYGINCIEGSIIIDESVFDSYPVCPSWQWNDLGNYYASGAWGLNINENQYLVRFKNRSKKGQVSEIHQIYPYVPNLEIQNEVTIAGAGTGDNAYIFGGPYDYKKRVSGTIPQGEGLFTIKGSLPDPSAFFLFHFREKLRQFNIDCQGMKTIYKAERKNKKSIYTHKSPSLESLVKACHTESINLYSESFLKIMGYTERGQGSGQNGIAVIRKKLRLRNIDYGGMRLHDGCGLSPRNLISTSTVAGYLASLGRTNTISEIVSHLPEGGKEGTVKHLFTNMPVKGHVWLKSGSMQSVQSYAGFIQCVSGKWVSFAIIVNGYHGSGSDIRYKLSRIINDIYQSC